MPPCLNKISIFETSEMIMLSQKEATQHISVSVICPIPTVFFFDSIDEITLKTVFYLTSFFISL